MKTFQRTKEDFICEHCGTEVKGDGYTNHCPHCLYSKHVDINPGDREEDCGGLMEPVDLELKDGKYIIVHRCQRCGFVRRNKVDEGDDFNAVIDLSRKKVETLKG
ncbi:MAG: RNHCP domain-containing protein [Alphaproteobacteria bacterium]|nr:RNHCP domain-containing protein [Alphaproteobacteria bacterium]MBQ7285632.1 RNHCP domain-containing protein [Alphaproteobacteria bacterium]